MNNSELIVIEQLPVIVERLATLKGEIKSKVDTAVAMECTAENKQIVKDMRSTLNKEFFALEEKRKCVKKAVLDPYQQFEGVYKDCVSEQYIYADTQLKAKIDEIETAEKAKMQNKVVLYLAEYASSKNVANICTFENSGINITLSVSEKKLKEQAKAFVERICDDLALIETQEHKAEILVEYKQSLNVSQAITTVSTRIQAIEEQKRLAEERAQAEAVKNEVSAKVEEVLPPPVSAPLQAPVVQEDADPVFTVSFRATAPKSKLKALKEYMKKEGIKYE